MPLTCFRTRFFGYVLAISLCASAACASPQTQEHWIASWATAQQVPEPQNALPAADFTNATLRQVVHLSAGGERIRLHLSNAFGTQPLRISSVHVAVPRSASTAATMAGTDRQVLFNGQAMAFLPAGAEVLSDPIVFHAAALSSLAISLFLVNPPQQQTGHPGSHATTYYGHGDLTAAEDFPASAGKVEHWYQIAAVDVAASSPAAFTVVALGDSITDGHGATTNGNDRWPDVLATRMHAAFGNDAAVVNAGIGGNRMLLDGLGPNVLARFDRDALAPAGARWVILLEGVNDLGTATRDQEISQADHDALVARVTGSYEQVLRRAHAHGLRVAGATITPFVGSDYYHPGSATEADRQKINAWIRAAGHFDAVIDFDAVMRNPAAPDRMLPAFDSGDHLHPSPKGYAAMAASIRVDLFGSVLGKKR